jgi:hypothetical protein
VESWGSPSGPGREWPGGLREANLARLRCARSSPSGSRLAFTYTPKDFIDGKVLYGQEYLHRRMLLKDRLWLFGLDPVRVDGFVGE